MLQQLCIPYLGCGIFVDTFACRNIVTNPASNPKTRPSAKASGLRFVLRVALTLEGNSLSVFRNAVYICRSRY